MTTMFDTNSRYAGIPVAEITITGADGVARNVKYVRRRFLPRSAGMTVASERTINDSDRLDLITSDALGDPTLFWRIADLNDAMNPFDLTAKIGYTLRISGLSSEAGQ
jgi:hypothetical protein